MKKLIAILMLSASALYASSIDRFEKGWFSLDCSFEMLLMHKIPFTFSGNEHLKTGAMMGIRPDIRINIWPVFLLLRTNDYFPSAIDRHAFDTLSLKTQDATIDMVHAAIGLGVNAIDLTYFRTSFIAGNGVTGWWAIVRREDSISGVVVDDIQENHRCEGNFIETDLSLTPYKRLFINTNLRKTFDSNRSLFAENSIGWRIYNSKKENKYCFLGLTYGYLHGRNFSYSTIGFSVWGSSSSI